MDTYDRFIFDSYKLDTSTRQIHLRYRFDDAIRFTETLTLPADTPIEHAENPDVKRALFALHLVGGISYYKAFCPPTIQVDSGKLNAQQAAFWDEFYTQGLGEFFYRNHIDFHGLVNFPTDPDAPQNLTPNELPAPRKALVPFGGGKDSQVTVELLKRHGINITLFRMQPHHFITDMAKLNALSLLQVSRALDPQLFELNAKGALNGHVPITGYITFLTIVVALLHGFDSVFFSNERSSDYGNVEYLGMQVNHQWSKSNEAEHMMRGYIEQFITKKTQYLNTLRPLSELHIAKIFTREPRYFTHVTSCNRNWLWNKLDANPSAPRWCGECEKCAFVFALFAAFLPLNQVEGIFNKNLFNDARLLPFYRQLWGAEAFKPFECVGTPKETKAALYLATRQADYAETAVGKGFIAEVLPTIPDPEALVQQALTPDYTDVPAYVANMVKKEVSNENK